MTALATFFLANWRWVLPTAAAIGLAVALGWSRMQLADERAAHARDLAKIAQMALEAEQHAREQEQKDADHARDIQVAHDEATAAAAASRDDFAARLADGVRRARAACRGSLPGAAANPAGPGEGDARNDGGHRPDDPGRAAEPELGPFLAIRDLVKSLQASGIAGVGFAHVCGR